MPKLVMLRHGESTWNLDNRFTGWTDVDLSSRGTQEAAEGGRLMLDAGFAFDIAYTSVLKRAIRTLHIALESMDLMWLPVVKDYRLNERHYGALQGLNKAETAAQYGDDQVLVWRRSFDIPPPPLEPNDERFAGNDRRYAHVPKNEIPLTESLKETIARVIPYWNEVIAPDILAGKQVLIVAHGNSLRALAMHLDNISKEEIVGLNIPTGIPLVYELDENLKPITHYYLGDPEIAAKAAAAVASQGKASADIADESKEAPEVQEKLPDDEPQDPV